MYGYIYKTTNLINGKIYIGQHIGEFTPNYKGSGIILKKAFDKYGKENFCTVLIDIAWDKQDLDNKEIFWISFLRSQTPNVGYNLSGGGYPMNNYHHTDETRRKISIANRGKKRQPLTEEHKKKLSESHKGKPGRPCSDETRLKIGNANKGNKGRTGQHNSAYWHMRIHESKYGTHHTDETRRKMSENHADFRQPVMLIIESTGDTFIIPSHSDQKSAEFFGYKNSNTFNAVINKGLKLGYIKNKKFGKLLVREVDNG